MVLFWGYHRMIISSHGTLQSSFAKIVKNGLVLWYDAMNNNSYPETGTTWTDLSEKGYNGTLVNGPTFQSASTEFLSRSGWTAGSGTTNSSTFSSSIDNNISTRWTTGTLMAIGNTYAVDFGKTLRLTSFTMDTNTSNTDYPATFAISHSLDNSTWTVEGVTSGSAIKTYTFASETDIRYLTCKVVSTNNAWWSIHEFTAQGVNRNDGGSISFDGSNDYVNSNTTLVTETGGLFASASLAWSVSSWFRPDTTNTTNGGIVTKSGGTGASATFVVWESGTTLNTRLRGGTTRVITSNMTTDWHEVVITWDGTTARAYYDGSYINTVAIGTAALQAPNFTIGAANTGLNDWFLGRIADVKVYNRALSDQEITQNYTALRRRFGV